MTDNIETPTKRKHGSNDRRRAERTARAEALRTGRNRKIRRAEKLAMLKGAKDQATKKLLKEKHKEKSVVTVEGSALPST
jgi:hypothetical protein